jgi:hypothetical protein
MDSVCAQPSGCLIRVAALKKTRMHQRKSEHAWNARPSAALPRAAELSIYYGCHTISLSLCVPLSRSLEMNVFVRLHDCSGRRVCGNDARKKLFSRGGGCISLVLQPPPKSRGGSGGQIDPRVAALGVGKTTAGVETERVLWQMTRGELLSC